MDRLNEFAVALAAIWQVKDRNHIAAVLCRHAVEVCGYAEAAVLELRGGGSSSEVLARYPEAGPLPEEPLPPFPWPVESPADLLTDERWTRLRLDPCRTRLLPMDGGTLYQGLLLLSEPSVETGRRGGTPRTDELARLASLAGLALAQHLEVFRLHEQVAALSLLSDLKPVTDAEPAMEQLLGRILLDIRTAFRADGAGVMLYNSEFGELVLQRPAFGMEDWAIDEYRIAIPGEGNGARVFMSGIPYYSNEAAGDGNILQYFVRLFQVKNLATIALEDHEKRIGVLHVINKTTGPWGPVDVHLLQSLARPIGYIIENARLIATLREQREELLAQRDRLEAQNAIIREQNATLSTLTALPTDLLADLLQGGGIAGMTGVLGRLVPNPLLVMDERLMPLSDRKFTRGVPSQAPPDPGGATWLEDPADPALSWVPIRSREAVLGYIVADVSKRPLTGLDVAILEQGAAFAAVELMHQQRLVETRLRMRGDLLDGLIEAQERDEPTLLRQAHAMGIDLHAPRWLLVLGVPPSHQTEELKRIRQWVTQVFTGNAAGVVILKGDHLVFTLRAQGPNQPDPDEVQRQAAQMRNRARVELRGIDLRIGIGSCCARPADYPGAYSGALRALKLARQFSHTPVLAAWDVGYMGLLLDAAGADRLVKTGQQVLAPLLAAEGQDSVRLLDTLWAFLENNGNFRMAAVACHAHVNTVRYRIQQAERLLGRDLSQAAYRTELLLALQVLRLAAEGRASRSDAEMPSRS